MIPLILHNVWIPESNADVPRKFLLSCQERAAMIHPRWQFMSHADAFILNDPSFASIHKPLVDCWDRFSGMPTSRSDLLRLCVLFVHGGIYIDHDVWCLWPFDDLLDRDLLLAADRINPLLIGEHVMGAVPRSTKIARILQRFICSAPNRKSGKYSPRITRWAIECGWEAMLPEVFCPSPRIVGCEDDAYKCDSRAYCIHCWSKFEDEEDVEYSVDRLRSISGKLWPT